jgi:hypothetical protein
MIVLLVMAAVVVAAPLGAAVLVTVASHREDAARSIAGRPPGPFAALARTVVCLRVGGTAYRRRQTRRHAPARGSAADSASSRSRTLTLPRV